MSKSEPVVPAVLIATANGCGFNFTSRPIWRRLYWMICARAIEVELVVWSTVISSLAPRRAAWPSPDRLP